jgi:hypothetical protein
MFSNFSTKRKLNKNPKHPKFKTTWKWQQFLYPLGGEPKARGSFVVPNLPARFFLELVFLQYL